MSTSTVLQVPTAVAGLVIDRPLCFFDLETTGTDVANDRIVEISVLMVQPGGEAVSKTRRVNPGMPIPQEATDVHGISDVDVRGEPEFSQIARGLWEALDPCDLAGYNIRRFDLPLLMNEFQRCGMALDPMKGGRRLLDLCYIFKARERRDLAAASLFYGGEVLEDAHSAEADTLVLPKILAGQMTRYDLSTLDEVHQVADELAPYRSEIEEWFGDQAKENPVFQRGKWKGRTIAEVHRTDPSYLGWMLTKADGLSEKLKDFLRMKRREIGGET